MEILAITADLLQPIVAQLVDGPTVAGLTWSIAPLAGATANPDRALYRITGTAPTAAGPAIWSVMLKVRAPPLNVPALDPAHPWHWRREAFIAESGLLTRLPRVLVTPACYGVTDHPDGSVWVWLAPVSWTELPTSSRLAGLGYPLGVLAGEAARWPDLDALPWLSRGLLQAWSAEEAYIIDAMRDPFIWRDPLLRDTPLPALAPAVVPLWEERERWFAALDGLPQTFCHHDTWPGNVRLSRDAALQRWLLIDWECSGHGVVGADIGNWIGTCLLNGDVPVALAPTFTASALEQFVAGLQASRWPGNHHQAVAAARAVAALRCVFSVAGWPAAMLLQPERREQHIRESEVRWKLPITALFAHWAAVAEFLLREAELARATILS